MRRSFVLAALLMVSPILPVWAQPPNDDCEDAIVLECGDTISGSTTTSTFDDTGFCGTSNTAPGIWYSVAHDGIITASTCNQADYDTKISVYDGGCDTLSCVTGRDDSSGCAGWTTEVSWSGDGTEDLILVHGFASAVGDFDLTVTCVEPAENDDCEDAIGPLAVDSVTSGSTTNATLDEPPSLDCGTSVTAPGVWYTVIGTGNTMTASTCNDGDPTTGDANYDTKISVYCADCEVKECIGGVDDTFGCTGFSTQFSWPTNPGQTYSVLVHGFSSQTGDFNLAILDDEVPTLASNDCDGVPAFADYCSATLIPESVPTVRLRPNRWALVDDDGVFDTLLPPGGGPPFSFTTEDTAGCSCEQIIHELGLGLGHAKFGCSNSAMLDWVDFVSALCGNCLVSNETPGCQNGDCEAAVCAVDPHCCDVRWDDICAAEAHDICEWNICDGLAPGSGVRSMTVEGGRAPVPEPVSKDPNYTPKE